MSTVAFILLAVAPADMSRTHVYDVHVDADLQKLEVRACFADGLPDRLIADHSLARKATSGFRYRLRQETVSRPVTASIVAFEQPSDDGCIEWRSDLSRIAEVNRVNIGYPAGNALVLATGTWFWRPPVLTSSRDIEIRFQLPPGFRVSVPWRPLDGIGTRFRHSGGPLGQPALMAVGELDYGAFHVGRTLFHLSITDGPASVERRRVERWLLPAANAVMQLWGEFPVEAVQLLVVPMHDGYDAAPWAQTNRGGGAGAHFFMNAGAQWPVFRDDWIATHELVHFALPFVHRSDAWLSEGFASYYQNVLRARAGMITPEQAWQSLYEGLLRGNRNAAYETLQDDTRYMHSRGRAMRVYWSGAAIALLADVELRRRSGGEWSLDRVLEEFHRCCRQPERSWSGRALFSRFDEISGTDVFDTLYARNVYSRHFPRTEEVMKALGVVTDGERIRLRDDAPGVTIRRAIMQPLDEPGAAGNY